MNDRKLHVLQVAYQLFIEKGFQATSIQDILECSGISKGTFYNYFSSKNELLLAHFKEVYRRIAQERNELLIGQDRSSIDIFIQQIELQVNANEKHKFFALFEEVLLSNNEELKESIKKGQIKMLKWIYERFVDLFGEEKKPYLLDGAIMFMGILHNNMKYYVMANESKPDVSKIVRYSVERVAKMMEEVAQTGEYLNRPELLTMWLPEEECGVRAVQQSLHRTIIDLKKSVARHEQQTKYMELLDFLQDECIHAESPRRFLVETALLPLKENHAPFENEQVNKLEVFIQRYFTEKESGL
ncbi:TetR/AcrR family transcriptional regulator [Bacillus sp. CGMCC 1.16541]|uniref:TetR/AcrR family transcriptional regulator n=1 Tax=Bacillus sp. CGMCC 1.16541 TaxID=2185143 RepID=UPI000D730EF0|nr:TetR/AcrR family transcriptional regulator [Bacillus sp. CGMCC 1.16541]